MIARSSFNESLVQFAQLCAALDNGFGGRAGVLAAAGLDEAGWQRLCDDWLPQIAAPDVAVSFTRAYEQARREQPIPADSEPMRGDVTLTEADDEDTLVDANGPVLVEPDVTVSVAFPLAGPALPFRHASFGQADAFAPPPVEPVRGLPPTDGDAVDATLEIVGAPLPAHAALPFPQPPANSRRQRLLRFDPHTGRPLAAPRWVDDPDPPPSAR